MVPYAPHNTSQYIQSVKQHTNAHHSTAHRTRKSNTTNCQIQAAWRGNLPNGVSISKQINTSLKLMPILRYNNNHLCYQFRADNNFRCLWRKATSEIEWRNSFRFFTRLLWPLIQFEANELNLHDCLWALFGSQDLLYPPNTCTPFKCTCFTFNRTHFTRTVLTSTFFLHKQLQRIH